MLHKKDNVEGMILCWLLQGVVDLRLVAQAVSPGLVQSAGASLAALALGLLGREVDKEEQCSAWGSRTLSRVGASAAHGAAEL